MSRSKQPQAYRLSDDPQREAEPATVAEATRTLELREEQLVAHKARRDVGAIEVRTEIDEVPRRLEVDAYRDEVVIEHETVGQVVSERDKPWEEAGTLIVPIYEEQLVVTKRLVLRERLRIRRVATTERQLYQDTLRRERLVIEDPQHTGQVRERYAVDDPDSSPGENGPDSRQQAEPDSDFLGNLVRKALE